MKQTTIATFHSPDAFDTRATTRWRPRMTALFAGLLLGVHTMAFAAPVAAENEAMESDRAERSDPEARAAAPPRLEDENRQEAARESREAWSPVLYVPPSRGQARHTAAGGTRGSARMGSLELAVIAPRDHVAFTTRAQPRLYWYVSESVEARIDVMLVDEDAIDPLLELTVPAPTGPGIQVLDLALHGVTLEPDRVYSWHVALVRDEARRSNDLLAEGFIQRTAEAGASDEPSERAVAEFARSGIWYDAIDSLRRALDASPQDDRLRRQQTALLEQAELAGVAKQVR